MLELDQGQGLVPGPGPGALLISRNPLAHLKPTLEEVLQLVQPHATSNHTTNIDQKYGSGGNTYGGNNYTKGYQKEVKGLGQKGRAKMSEAAARNINQGDGIRQGGIRVAHGSGMMTNVVTSTMINDLQKEFFGR